jgi:hypothetical protein
MKGFDHMMKLQRIAFRNMTMLALLFLSACRFGNYTEVPKSGTDYTLTALATQATGLQSIVMYHDGTPRSENLNTPLNAIPSAINNTFTNPVNWVVPTNSSMAQFFYSSMGYSLPTKIDSTETILDEQYTDVVQLWKNPNCLTQVQYFQDGYIDRTRTTSKTKGQLVMDLTVIRVIEGLNAPTDCAADLAELAACYQNPGTCPTGSVDAARTLFDLWVQYGGVLNLNQVSQMNALAYVVQFR